MLTSCREWPLHPTRQVVKIKFGRLKTHSSNAPLSMVATWWPEQKVYGLTLGKISVLAKVHQQAYRKCRS
jgi:hypothetical protein